MPLLKRKEFEKISPPELLRDDEDVFFCEETKEIFRNYDDYFARIMMINSMVWSCSLTGKPNLTYAEAAESEIAARKTLSAFPSILKGPILLVASLTKRSAFGDLVEDVLSFMKDRYFKNEKLDVLAEDGKNYLDGEIVEVISNLNGISSSPVKADAIKYLVKTKNGKQSWITTHENLRRDRIKYTREKNKLFLKQHLEHVNGMLKIKDASYKKFVTDADLKFEEVFRSKAPDFQLSKRLLNKEEKRKSVSKAPDTKKKSTKKDDKQPSISNYLNKSETGITNKANNEKKKLKTEKKLKDEMERMRMVREKQLADEKALNEEIKNICVNMNLVRDDLEMQDSKKLPVPKPVHALIGNKYFGDFVQILEFMNTFSEILSINDKFPHGLTMDLLERALLVREVNGPLTDILQVLLSTIFSLQIEEENEVEIKYDPNVNADKKREDMETFRNASRTQLWCKEYYSMNLNELVMDCTTISELLRLHLLSSGALIDEKGSRWRFYNRGGYVNTDDPGLLLRQHYPHILRALHTYSVYQLPMNDVMKIIKCLMDQILTYSSVRDVIEERLTKSAAAKIQYNHWKYNEKRRETKVLDNKKQAKIQVQLDIQKFVPKDTSNALNELVNYKTEIESNLENAFNDMDAASSKEKKKNVEQIEKYKSEIFAYQIYLGSDRAHRNYWLFESLPGLFVEHSFVNNGLCYENCVEHIPGLVNCPRDQRSKFIKQMILNKKANNDKENNNKSIQNGVLSNGGVMKVETNNLEKDAQQFAKDLFMCTANINNCPIHTENYTERVTWSYFNTPEEINELIESLNTRGFRERALQQSLEIVRDLILDHISNCPVDKLNVNIEKKDAKLQEIIQNGHKKYNQVNFSGKDVNMTLDANFRDNILELEYKIAVGYLGMMNVKNVENWRKSIESFSFNKECDELCWGVNKSKNDTTDNVYTKDPGHDLGNTLDVESEDSADEGISLHDSPTLKENVYALACALLQIEQGIERKFLRTPFGPKREIRDKTLMAKFYADGQKKISKWEESLMRCTSYAQLFLHYNILFDTIVWSRSALKMNCMICRRKENPEKTLLCDECNRGCHIYCLKPKLTKIPQGDWFCPRCKPEFHIKEKVAKTRKIFSVSESENENESSDAESENEEQISEQSSSESDDGSIEVCKVCNTGGELVRCASTQCRMKCHFKCAKPTLKRMPTRREIWQCEKCNKQQLAERKRKGVPVSEEEFVETKPNKKGRPSNLENGNYKKKNNHIEEEIESEDEEENIEDEEEEIDNDEEDEVEEEEEEEEEEDEDQGIRTRRSKNKIKLPNGNRKSKYVYEDASDDEEIESTSEGESTDEQTKGKRKRRGVIKYGFTKTENKSSLNTRRSNRKSEQKKSSRYSDEPPIKKKRSSDVTNSSSRRSKRSSDDFPLHSVLLYSLLDDITKHKDSWPFNRPVSQKEVPDYYKIIKTPMDFAKIKSKLNCGEYKTDDDIMTDIQLVFINCDLYNTNATDIYKAGINLEKFVKEKCKELNLPFKPSDMIADTSSGSSTNTNSRKKRKFN